MIKFDDVMAKWTEYRVNMKAMDFNLDEEAELIAADMAAMLTHYHDALVRIGKIQPDYTGACASIAKKAIEGLSDD